MLVARQMRLCQGLPCDACRMQGSIQPPTHPNTRRMQPRKLCKLSPHARTSYARVAVCGRMCRESAHRRLVSRCRETGGFRLSSHAQFQFCLPHILSRAVSISQHHYSRCHSDSPDADVMLAEKQLQSCEDVGMKVGRLSRGGKVACVRESSIVQAAAQRTCGQSTVRGGGLFADRTAGFIPNF